VTELKRGGAKKYNPDNPVRTPTARGFLLYLLPMPMLFLALWRMLGGNSSSAFGFAVCFALCMVAATLVRKGLGIEQEAKRRKIVRRSSTVPYKAIGAGILGVAIFTGALLGAKITLFSSLLLGLASAIGAVFTYGTDPSRNAPDMSAVGVTSEEVLEILDEADQKILAIEAARDRIHNVEMKDRLKKIVTGVREITDIVEDDPRDLRRARKFLRTYLDGAQRVTEGYADTHKYGDDGELENNFRNVLDTIETVIEEQKGKLLENNLTELDVQIEVLQMQLEKEGV